VNQPTVLIVADDAEFPRSLMKRWAKERHAPALTIVNRQTLLGSGKPMAEVAVVGGMGQMQVLEILPLLAGHVPVILYVADSAEVNDSVHENCPRICILQNTPGWDDAVVALANESLRRLDAVNRARAAEERATQQERYAALGRYMLEMRHSFSNALTSVLGNSELLLMDPGNIGEEARAQLETIHGMSLRMHEILQRFSSLDKEMQFASKKSQGETGKWPTSLAAGS
jgi:signal transduction histidine kinase